MHRFFFNEHLAEGRTVLLPEEESHHIRNVLRLQPGGEVELFNGSGEVARARIASISRRIELEITDYVTVDEESGPTLVVGQGAVKGKYMELIIQKCTELGVSEFSPVVSNRSQQGYLKGQVEKKYQRWRRIVEGACCQCGRNRLMELTEIVSFDEFLMLSDPSPGGVLKLIFWEREKALFINELQTKVIDRNVIVLLGPEGGFTEQEIDKASECGFQAVGLGSRILRAETATIAAVAILQNMLGNMK